MDIQAKSSSLLQVQTGSPAIEARRWFINSYPLFGAMAMHFDLIEDAEVCNRQMISIAAVSPQAQEIYINPEADLGEAECKFVMAHEFLHVGLSHHSRCQGRDPYLWNIACDYVINGWLQEMKLGIMPGGALYDEELKGVSAEAVYDRIVRDLRRSRCRSTLRGNCGYGDIIQETPDWWLTGEGVDLNEFYRRCLTNGLLPYHSACSNRGAKSRGVIPTGLVEEVKSLAQPALSWEIQLGSWFEKLFGAAENVRSYARPSRRQDSTPNIARPRYIPGPPHTSGETREIEHRTFGVVLDSSGSMDRVLLGKGLGAIASYSASRGVSRIRVVHCDASPYDCGYVQLDDLHGFVKVKGRGGTVLQPAIDLLEKASDFPGDGPILVITDGACDRVSIKREHAFLMPIGALLPMVPRGPVFRMS